MRTNIYGKHISDSEYRFAKRFFIGLGLVWLSLFVFALVFGVIL